MIALPPTPIEAHNAARIVVKDIADPFDSTFRVSDCARVGKRSRVCHASINGPLSMRLRVTVTSQGEDLIVRAREERS